jgi:cyclopropane fatty-acyl-phospholipid synthase-like methyltransferase
MVRYDPAVYDGAAVHYRYGRPAYSPGLEALLAEELGLDGSGRLLDVGCGPGTLAVRLARLFEEAAGLDPDPEMIAEGRRAAQERGIANITWVQALAEDLAGWLNWLTSQQIPALGQVTQDHCDRYLAERRRRADNDGQVTGTLSAATL